jgi:hypothetical protein
MFGLKGKVKGKQDVQQQLKGTANERPWAPMDKAEELKNKRGL